jgi:hypothetical protein
VVNRARGCKINISGRHSEISSFEKSKSEKEECVCQKEKLPILSGLSVNVSIVRKNLNIIVRHQQLEKLAINACRTTNCKMRLG